jgi:pimeloyl-ACP methyl ester carboxylesterase
MATVPTLPGITSKMIPTSRIRQHVLLSGPEDGIPVVFVHGNFSGSTYWEELMLRIPGQYRCIAPDLRGYGDTEDLLVDATRGARDWSDDLKALSDVFGDRPAHMVGWSLGAAPVSQFLIDYPELVRSITFVNPISPYGFNGCHGTDGKPNYPDFAGSGGGTVNPEFVKRIVEGDRSADDPNSPRNVINTFYYKAPFRAAREDAFLDSAMLEKTGPDRYPGDLQASNNWPNVAPGVWGPMNATSPKYYDTSAIASCAHKPPILWVRGDSDQIVSDLSVFEFGTLGQLGLVPGWPGEEIYPPQPMVSQTRAVLDAYRANGGRYDEFVVQDAAHSPHIEQPDVFLAKFGMFLEAAA